MKPSKLKRFSRSDNPFWVCFLAMVLASSISDVFPSGTFWGHLLVTSGIYLTLCGVAFATVWLRRRLKGLNEKILDERILLHFVDLFFLLITVLVSQKLLLEYPLWATLAICWSFYSVALKCTRIAISLWADRQIWFPMKLLEHDISKQEVTRKSRDGFIWVIANQDKELDRQFDLNAYPAVGFLSPSQSTVNFFADSEHPASR
jgi:hypothetical protein